MANTEDPSKDGGMEPGSVPPVPKPKAPPRPPRVWGKSQSKDHAPAPERAPRPKGEMAIDADRQAFRTRQARMSEPETATETRSERVKERMERFHETLAKDRDHAFNGERFQDRGKGALSVLHNEKSDKGGMER